MNKLLRLSLWTAFAMSATGVSAQSVDFKKYPDYSSRINPDQRFMQPMRSPARNAGQRPDYVNNAETRYFPPVFNQDGGSCGSASRICYMFSHELNSFRDLDGKDPDNYYPSHFVWLLTYGNSGKDEFVQHVGVPSATTYGGQTYSKYFGNQDTEHNYFGWMQGYEKWYSAMFNRMLKPTNFPLHVGTEEGREAVKQYLWNHNGDTDFHSGGIVGIGVASGGDWQPIPNTPTNKEIGVAGKYFVNKWGTQVDHALTIVGYDDRIEFDLNKNGVYGEAAADEKGAWIIVNSWGAGWCNNGFIYCPYAYGGAWFTEQGTFSGSWWSPEIYSVRKNYRPQRTIKIEMDYSRRSELYLSAGVSTDLNATEPDLSQGFDHFKYAGDGANGNTVPAPEVPMLGRWADGKMHTEPMEFGYDLTDLTASFDANMPLKYFFVIETKSTAEGTGHVRNASIIDYAQDDQGIETPMEISTPEGVEIKNAGNRTIISIVVQGRGVYAPQNAAIAEGAMTWNAPVRSALKLTGYKVYCDGKELATLDASTTRYALPTEDVCTYELSAIYDTQESSKVAVDVPYTGATNQGVNFRQSGFSIPDVFGAKYEQATIEYWINCSSLSNWNQSAGPGWGKFMFHANSDGRLTVGWDTSNRIDIAGAYQVGVWKHIAIVVDKSNINVYVNGTKKGSLKSDKYSGVGGFGDLVFTANGGSSLNAKIDEMRIWKTARTQEEIQRDRNLELGDASLPANLVAYFKGDLIAVNGEKMLRDHTIGGHHAEILNSSYTHLIAGGATAVKPSTTLTVSIDKPSEPVYVGIPASITASASSAAQSLTWTATNAGIENAMVVSPRFVFTQPGEQQVSVVATARNKETATAETTVTVLPAPAPVATFKATMQQVPAGKSVSFLATDPKIGYIYKWSMPGADKEEATTVNAAATYPTAGNYEVTLTVTAPDGTIASNTQNVEVTRVAPLAAFDVQPAVVVKGEKVHLVDLTKYEATAWNWQLKSDNHMYLSTDGDQWFEPTVPGRYDVKLTASNDVGTSVAEQARALVVCNADSKNGLNFAYDQASVTATKVPFEGLLRTFTVDWWMRPSALSGTLCNGIGDNASTLLITSSASGEMTLNVSGRSAKCDAGFVIPDEWHHYAITFSTGTVKFYRDGELVATKSSGASTAKLPEKFAIGTEDAPFRGQIDEFRVWAKALSLEKLRNYICAPIEGTDLEAAETDNGLKIYYQFNQSSGDVQDMTSAANHGIRTGFGPEGDAWGLSRGVFSLNFDNGTKDVTATYLKNYHAPFKTTGEVFNPQGGRRFMTIADWTLENKGTEPNPTGAHVDANKSSYMTFTTEWDGFATTLSDHKCFQTVTLPAGTYIFSANFGAHESASAGSYIAAAVGNTLPVTADLGTKSIAYAEMEPKSAQVSGNSVIFVLNEETEVSLGLVVNMSNKNCFTLQNFTLNTLDTTTITPVPSGIDNVETTPALRDGRIYDLSGRRVLTPVKGGVYIINGQKVLVK